MSIFTQHKLHGHPTGILSFWKQCDWGCNSSVHFLSRWKAGLSSRGLLEPAQPETQRRENSRVNGIQGFCFFGFLCVFISLHPVTQVAPSRTLTLPSWAGLVNHQAWPAFLRQTKGKRDHFLPASQYVCVRRPGAECVWRPGCCSANTLGGPTQNPTLRKEKEASLVEFTSRILKIYLLPI